MTEKNDISLPKKMTSWVTYYKRLHHITKVLSGRISSGRYPELSKSVPEQMESDLKVIEHLQASVVSAIVAEQLAILKQMEKCAALSQRKGLGELDLICRKHLI